MDWFKETTHLSDILEESKLGKVAIFKYSSQCGSSSRLKEEIENKMSMGLINCPVYKITVQNQPAISKNIETWFQIKHESPQIIIVDNGKVLYYANHNHIDLKNLAK